MHSVLSTLASLIFRNNDSDRLRLLFSMKWAGHRAKKGFSLLFAHGPEHCSDNFMLKMLKKRISAHTSKQMSRLESISSRREGTSIYRRYNKSSLWHSKKCSFFSFDVLLLTVRQSFAFENYSTEL
ncbi:hypothetical protein Tcan_00088 [Toxocara canis]|uniref:Uncharacterized protein n=1 Tax=Toxocara canis TaxID=6265 RepID=A0A0B2VL61_TOXCA|nr:hypothetical protein Tcan_00088 [Toxocara canis]